MPEPEAKGIFIAITECADPSREDDYNRWYNEEHLPTYIGLGPFFKGTRWVNTDPASPYKYLALYETTWDDPLAARNAANAKMAELQAAGKQAPVHDCLRVVFWGTFRRVT